MQINSQSLLLPIDTSPLAATLSLAEVPPGGALVDDREIVRRLAALAGVPLSEERIAALARTLLFVQTQVARLADLNYREAEPAGRFRPRSEEPR